MRQVIASRYEKGSLIATSNLPIAGESYRLQINLRPVRFTLGRRRSQRIECRVTWVGRLKG